MYLKPTRYYRNKKTGKESPLLHEVIGQRATIKRDFNAGLRKGTWQGTPFEEVGDVPPGKLMLPGLRDLKAEGDPLSVRQGVPMLFDAVMASVESAWDPDKFHVVFHSSGWDSRIISAAVKRLAIEHGADWLGKGLLFLSNRWEADETESIILAEGWKPENFAAYTDGKTEDHFGPWLDFDDFWRTSNAPIPLPGNLWWYLPDWAQSKGLLPEDDQCQAFAGFFANETWRCFNQGGARVWHDDLNRWYYYTVLTVYRAKLPMEYPLTDLDVLKLVSRVRDTSGDRLRQAVAEYSCSEANGVIHLTHDDHQGQTISNDIRARCEKAYAGSWYARHVHKDWRAPGNPDYDLAWTRWGLASLVEELVRRGVEVR